MLTHSAFALEEGIAYSRQQFVETKGTAPYFVNATVPIIARYVLIAPLFGAVAQKLPRHTLLVTLDILRAYVVAILPFVTEAWQGPHSG